MFWFLFTIIVTLGVLLAARGLYLYWRHGNAQPATLGKKEPPINYDDLPEQAVVAKWRWVEIMNLEGISNGHFHFEFNDRAGIYKGGIVRKIREHGEQVLVSYQADKEVFSDECPNGAIFFLTKEEYMCMSAKYFDNKAVEQRQKDLVRSLLSGSPTEPQITIE